MVRIGFWGEDTVVTLGNPQEQYLQLLFKLPHSQCSRSSSSSRILCSYRWQCSRRIGHTSSDFADLMTLRVSTTVVHKPFLPIQGPCLKHTIVYGHLRNP